MAFRVGQKVVCVTTEPIHRHSHYSNMRRIPNKLNAGTVYTIRDVDHRYTSSLGEPAVRLEEFVYPEEPCGWGMVEPAFASSRFRPVVSTDTGMAILEQIRRDATNKELRPIWEDEQV